MNVILVTGKLYEMMDDLPNAIARYETVIQRDTTLSKAVRMAKFSLVMNYSDVQLLKWMRQLAINDKNSTLIFTALQDINSKYQFGYLTDLNNILEFYRISEKYKNRSFGFNPITSLVYNRSDRRDEFINFLNKHLQKNPKDVDAMILLGTLYNQNVEKDEAKGYFDKIVKQNPDNLRILQLASEYYAFSQNYDEAAVLTEQCVSLEKDTTLRMRHYYRLCSYYAQTRDVVKTEECIARLQKEFPGEMDNSQSLAGIYRTLNQPEKAIAIYKSYLASTVDNDRDDFNIQLSLANYYVQLNRTEEAMPLFQSLLEKNPEDYNLDRVLEGLLPIYIKQKNLDKFFATYDSISSQSGAPDRYSQWTWNVVNIAETKMMRSELQSRLEKRLEDKTLDLNLARVLLQCYQRTGMYRNSLSIYEYLYERYPNNTENTNSLYNEYQQKNNWKKVIELGEIYIKKGPGYQYMYPTLIQAYEKNGQADKAERLIQELNERAKSDRTLYPLLASIYQTKNMPQEGIRYYEQLVGTDSSNPQYLMMLANLYSQVSENRKAIQLYETVLAKRGLSQDMYNQSNLLRLYFRVGETKKAEEFLRQQLSRSQNDWQVKNMVQIMLQELLKQNQVDKSWQILVSFEKAIASKRGSQTPWQIAERIFGDRNMLPWDGKLLMQNLLESQLKKNPRQIMVYYLLDDIYQQNWETYHKVKGSELWSLAMKTYPEDPEPVLKRVGLQNYDAANRDAQIALYEKALSLREKQGTKDISQNYQIYFSLARLYVQSGKKEQSVRLLEMLSAQTTSRNINYTEQLANVYEQAGQYEQAIKLYEINLKNREDSMRGSALTNIIRCYAALKQYDKLEPLVVQLKDVATQPYQLEEAYRLLVNVYNQAEKYDKALEAYLNQVKASPQNYRYNGILNGLVNGNSNVFEDTVKAKKYMDVFNEYLKQHPKEILVQGMIAELSLWMGKISETK